MKRWTKVTATLASPPEDWSPWIEVFTAAGVPGTEQADTPPSISGYLPEGVDAGGLVASLTAEGASVQTGHVEEQDWAELWKQFFKPRDVGERWLVRPSWEEAAVPPGRMEIVLDPGQAFGTGDHPTTRMCLELLETEDLKGARVADIGCGSGILSVAAGKIGANEVWAVDSDPVAVQATAENARLNGVSISAFVGKGFDPLPDGAQYHLVLSNIISAALIGLAPQAPARVVPGGAWIVSGIIEPNWPDVLAAATRAGFTMERHVQEGDWIAATFRR